MDISPQQASQDIAHEMYRCIQDTVLARKPAGATRWAIEGSANYFSNLVFPSANLEREADVKYPSDLTIYKHNYDASLFFQAIEQSRGAPYIHK
jgi:hypothetical protein